MSVAHTDMAAYSADRQRRLDRERRKRLVLARAAGIPTSMVDAAPIRAHLRDLTGMGWSVEAIAVMHGDITATGLLRVLHGRHVKSERRTARVLSIPRTLAVPDSVPDECLVPSHGASRRVRALLAIGWSYDHMREVMGGITVHVLGPNNIREHVSALTWRLVSVGYDELSAIPGPSDRNRARAAKAGYLPPLAWDDIDDPDEHPNDRPLPLTPRSSTVDEVAIERRLSGDAKVRLSPAERAAAVARLARQGRSDAEMADRLGVTARTILRIRAAHDIPSTWEAP